MFWHENEHICLVLSHIWPNLVNFGLYLVDLGYIWLNLVNICSFWLNLGHNLLILGPKRSKFAHFVLFLLIFGAF